MNMVVKIFNVLYALLLPHITHKLIIIFTFILLLLLHWILLHTLRGTTVLGRQAHRPQQHHQPQQQ